MTRTNIKIATNRRREILLFLELRSIGNRTEEEKRSKTTKTDKL